MIVPHSHEDSKFNHAIMLEQDPLAWEFRMDAFMAQDARIIAFRGAGTVNGIDPMAAQKSVDIITGYLAESIESGAPIVLLFDGDEDNRTKPDIGSVYGSIVDSLTDKPNVFAVAAQTTGWYYPKSQDANLETATGVPIETYVFGDEQTHNDFTQSPALVGYRGYEQVVVDAAGPIALSQIQDISNKVIANSAAGVGPVLITVIEAPINASLDTALEEQLTVAKNNEARAKVQAKITQRSELPYGALFTSDGDFSVNPARYPGIAFRVISAFES